VLVPAVIELIIVLILRTRGTSTVTEAYTVNLDPSPVFETFRKQALAALPGSQWWLHYEGIPAYPLGLFVIVLVAIGIPAYASMVALAHREPVTAARWGAIVAGFGAWIWLTSAALVAITVRWQLELPWGQGYISGIYGYFGVAMVVGGLWAVGHVRTAGLRPGVRRVFTHGSALVVALACAVTVGGNLLLVSQ
jgi:hypothetical protein